MTEKYHVNPETGNPNKCTATKQCRFGGDDKHYFSKEAAQLAFEKEQVAQVTTVRKAVASKYPVPETAKNLPNLPDGRTFAEAWNDRFKNLAEWEKANPGKDPALIAPETLLTSSPAAIRERGSWLAKVSDEPTLKRLSIKGDYVVVLNTRQGGGNRECWCNDEENHDPGCLYLNNEELESHPDYVGDEDDDFDSTYASFYFDNGITEDKAKAFQEENNKRARLNGDRFLIQEANANELTPWATISTDPDIRRLTGAYRSEKDGLKRYRDHADEVIKAADNASKALKKINSGTVTKNDLAGLKIPTWTASRILEYSKEAGEAKKQVEKFEAMVDDAEKLPAGELRDYLLADRGTFQYQSSEKVGRRNVSVTKTGHRGTLLGSELKSTKERYESRKKILSTYTDEVKKIADTGAKAKKEFSDREKNLEDLRIKAWAAGWYGDPRELPKVPDSF